MDPALAPIQSSLGYLGMPGLTAYFGLLKVINAQPGDTIVVSAASGAVGQVVGQLVLLMAAEWCLCHRRKMAWCNQIGYDAGVNYR